MRIDLPLNRARRTSLAVGAGFIALDVIQGDHGDKIAAGGTCGNVMAVLAWLGWRSVPVARLGSDTPARLVQDDLKAAGVDTRCLARNASTPTPIVIQRNIVDDAGRRSHRFTMTCPECGQWLPRFRPFVRADATEAANQINAAPTVFFFDRTSAGIVSLARWARDKGALVMFEPISYSDDRHFRDAIELCHVLKFSHERLGHIRDFGDNPHPAIVIETLGADGLRIRWRGKWTHFNSFAAPRFVDTAGAGDWCSAGFLHLAGQDGAAGLKTHRKATIETAIRTGQALSAINCGYEGARGAMDFLTREKAAKILRSLAGGEGTLLDDDGHQPNTRIKAQICEICNLSGNIRSLRPKQAG
jgi:sugar/nucleoside kinase (ribokinase family)